MSKWNGKRFSVYTSDEKSALGLIKELGEQTNYNTDELEQVKLSDSKKVSHQEMQDTYKIDKDANFTGSWHGIEKPTASQEGLQATVDKIVEEDIPYINEQLDTNVQQLNEKINEVAMTGTTTEVLQNTTENYVQEKINDGTIANLTIENYTITGDKLKFNSVSPNNTTFLSEEYKNLVDMTKSTVGYIVNQNTGELSAFAQFSVTDFIRVEEGQQYSLSHTYNLAFYDKNKNYVSGLGGGAYTSPITIPSNVFYLRLTYDKTASCYISKGTTLNKIAYSSDTNRSVEIIDEKLVEEIGQIQIENKTTFLNNISSNEINLSKIEGYGNCGLINLYNKNEDEAEGTAIKPTDGSVYSDSGTVLYQASGYIEIVGNEEYCCSNQHNIAFYDSNKNYISGENGGWSNPLTSPSNAKYIRVTFLISATNRMFNKGEILLDYVEYGKVKIEYKDNYLEAYKSTLGVVALENELKNVNLSKLSGVKWEHMGDSISSIDYALPTWFQIIQEKTSCILNSYGISGTTLAHTDERHLWDYADGKLDATTIGYNPSDSSTWSTGNCFCERFIKMSDNAEIITVMGSTNDDNVTLGEWNSTDTSTFYGGLNVLIQGLLTKYPAKTIAFFTPIQQYFHYNDNIANASASLDAKKPTDTISLRLRAEAIKRKCKQYGIPCLDLFNESGFNGFGSNNSLLYLDGTHPTKLGQEILAIKILNFILSII